jgi:hypothetical protein
LQQSLSFYFKTTSVGAGESESKKYGQNHPQQKAITNALITDLIIQCNLPLSITENEYFQHFLAILDSQYTPVARSTIAVDIEKRVAAMKTFLEEVLSKVKTINMTVDIWTDRRMRAYMGVTAHYVIRDAEGHFTLKSSLLACDRFTGRHTGDRISAELENILDSFRIKQKVDCIITDNAANMRKALTLLLASSEEDEQEANEPEPDDFEVDNAEIWNDLEPEENLAVINAIESHCLRERLSCFDHTLHLIVGDGLKETRCVSAALAKVSKISSTLHTSASFKEVFEQVFGSRGIPAAIAVRWNSTLRQIKAVLILDFKTLCDTLEGHGLKNLVLTPREWTQVTELAEVLDPFLEATQYTEGEKVATLGFALPSALSLQHHLQELLSQNRLKHCNPVCNNLLASVRVRFAGMLKRVSSPVNIQTLETDVTGLPFGSSIYPIAAFVEPKFKLLWIDIDQQLTVGEKDQLRRHYLGK